MTDTERTLWGQLRRKVLHGLCFRRQDPIGPCVVDFVCHEVGLIIERDGGQHADQPSYDADRRAHLQGRGYRVVRFWNHEVLKDTDAVSERISAEYVCVSDSGR